MLGSFSQPVRIAGILRYELLAVISPSVILHCALPRITTPKNSSVPGDEVEICLLVTSELRLVDIFILAHMRARAWRNCFYPILIGFMAPRVPTPFASDSRPSSPICVSNYTTVTICKTRFRVGPHLIRRSYIYWIRIVGSDRVTDSQQLIHFHVNFQKWLNSISVRKRLIFQYESNDCQKKISGNNFSSGLSPRPVRQLCGHCPAGTKVLFLSYSKIPFSNSSAFCPYLVVANEQ